MPATTRFLLVLALALFSSTVYADYDDEDEGYGGGGGGGYGGDEEEAPPPPPSGNPEELTTIEDFEFFLDNNDASVIAAFPSKEIVDPSAVEPEGWDSDEDGEWEAPTVEHPTLTSFNEISGSVYGYRYAYTSAPEVLAKLKCKSSGLFLYRSPRFLSTESGDRVRERFPSDKLSESAVSLWLKSKAQPLVGMYSSSTKDRYKGPVLVIFMNLDFEKNGKSLKYVLKRARKAAAGLKGKLSIGVASVSDMSYELSDYGLTSTKPNTEILMGIADGSDFYSSDSDAAFSGVTLQAFADSFLKGELTPYVKPDEPPPADDDDDTPPEDDDMGDGDDMGEGDKEEM